MEQIGNDRVSVKGLAALYEWVEMIIFALVAVSLLFSLGARMVGVDGDSMMQTLHEGDRLLLRSNFYTPAHGDIVVIDRSQGDSQYRSYTNKPLIKRVIGIAGDVIRVDAVNNVVYRNGEPLDEPYVYYRSDMGESTGDIVVPSGKIFVLGDHRDESMDSRRIGLVDIEQVMGKAFFRLFPLGGFGFL